MIKVEFDPEQFLPNAPEDAKAKWTALMAEAAAATGKIIEEWEDYKDLLLVWKNADEKDRSPKPPEFDPKFDDGLWKGFRDWMKDYLFHNKCAYCETRIVGFIPDAEHFRPKGKVTYQSKAVTVPDDDGSEIVHPGYFWLAYNWKNLLPSCHLCNRYGGKKTDFPAESYLAVIKLGPDDAGGLQFDEIRSKRLDSVYYLQPEDLDRIEKRLLLHPFFDDPQEHIYFDMTGKALPRNDSLSGKESIRIFDLNEADKLKYRSKAQKKGYKYVMAKITDNQDTFETMKHAGEAALREFFQGEEEYAAAVYDYFMKLLPTPEIAPDRKKLTSRQA